MNNLAIQKPPATCSYQPLIKERDLAIDYLRSFVIVLVVFLHAALAYASFSTFNAANYANSPAAVVDASRWPFLDLFVVFFDTFMMPLLFLVSGLFTIPSLERKGSGGFFTARLQRLGIPFVFGAVLIAPVAFRPSYLLAIHESKTPYLIRFFTSDGWPVGAPWFLWVLLAFNGILALAAGLAPALLAQLRRPRIGLVILLAGIVSLVGLNLVVPATYWLSLGPFDSQPARLGLYLAFFLLGTALGTGQQWRQRGWLKYWGVWLALSAVAFFIYLLTFESSAAPSNWLTQVLHGIGFAGSCTGASFGLLGAFRRFVHRPHRILDSLTTNSYGIYIIHYGLVHWFQFNLLSVSWPASIKFSLTFIGTLALSWGLSMLIRQIPAVRRVL